MLPKKFPPQPPARKKGNHHPMDFASSSLFTPDFAYENELDFSSLITPSTLISFQEPNPCNPITHCEITNGDDEPKNKRAKHREIERQRRQEVTSLFKDLRYILPLQYVKVKYIDFAILGYLYYVVL